MSDSTPMRDMFRGIVEAYEMSDAEHRAEDLHVICHPAVFMDVQREARFDMMYQHTYDGKPQEIDHLEYRIDRVQDQRYWALHRAFRANAVHPDYDPRVHASLIVPHVLRQLDNLAHSGIERHIDDACLHLVADALREAYDRGKQATRLVPQ